MNSNGTVTFSAPKGDNLSNSPINVSVDIPPSVFQDFDQQHPYGEDENYSLKVFVVYGDSSHGGEQVSTHAINPVSSNQLDTIGLHATGLQSEPTASDNVTYITLETVPGNSSLSIVEISDPYIYCKNEIYPKEEGRRPPLPPYEDHSPPSYIETASQSTHTNAYMQKIDSSREVPNPIDYTQDFVDAYLLYCNSPASLSVDQAIHSYDNTNDPSTEYAYGIEAAETNNIEKRECLNCGSISHPSFQRDPAGHAYCGDCAGHYFKSNGINRPHVRAQRRGASPVVPHATGIVAPKKKSLAEKECSNCHTMNTTVWRRKINSFEPVCNACGVYFKMYGVTRPLSLKKNGPIQRRNRKPKSTSVAVSKNNSSLNPGSISVVQAGLKHHQAPSYVITSFVDPIQLDQYSTDQSFTLHDSTGGAHSSHSAHNSHLLPISPHQHSHIMGDSAPHQHPQLLGYTPSSVASSVSSLQVIKQLPVLEPIEDVMTKYEPTTST